MNMKAINLDREIIRDKALCRILGAMVFVILMSLGAFIRIPLPFSPVPITLQTFFVLLSGAFLGSGLGGLSQLGYLILGIAGVPVFSGAASGLFYAFGPTGGYLAGFIVSAFIVGKFIKYAGSNLFALIVLFLAADLILLLCGVLWLRVILGQDFVNLLSIGLVPFLPGDLLKIALAAGIYRRLKPRLEEIF